MKRILTTLYILLSAFTLFAQQTIKGRITDRETGSVMPGVTISFNGTTMQTNRNGEFELNSGSAASQITISFMGYESRHVTVTNEAKFINIQLSATTGNLNQVTVTGYNDNRKLLETAGSVSLLTKKDLDRNNGTDILPVLNTVSGVKMEEAAPGNFKISIRGSALRDPYGLRNVKLYWNEIPITSPDNSASHPLSFDPEDIGSIEIIKGPAGSIYGAGIGGVLLFKNDKPKFDQDELSTSLTVGSFGLVHSSTAYKTSSDNFNLAVNYENRHYDGYRQNEFSNRQAVNVYGQFYASPKRTISIIANHAEGSYGIAGSVDSTTAVNTPRKGVQYAIDNRTGVKKYTYTLTGISQDYRFSDNFTNTTGIYSNFQLLNHPYGQSAYYNGFLKQSTGGYGGRTKFTFAPVIAGIKSKFTVGDEFQYENIQGSTFDIVNDIAGTWPETGNLQSSNIVISKSNNVFAQAEFDLPENFFLTLGSSYNSLSYDVTDLVPKSATHANYTGVVSFDHTVSPRVALVKKFGNDIAAHASVSSGFSPPTVSEARNSDGSFNTSVEAEKGVNYEVGLRGTVAKKLNFDVSVYQLNLTNAILPFYNANGSESFRNAGATTQRGLELSMFYLAIQNADQVITLLKPWVSYTYNHYVFKDYVQESYDNTTKATILKDYSGNKVTGVTPNMLNVGVDLETKAGIYFNAVLNYYDKTPINDGNTHFQHGYTLIASKIGYRIQLNRFGVNVFAGGNNLLNVKYSSMVNFNADASGSPTFFNPSPGVNFYGGASVKYSFK